jgi:Phage integrase, N-terminal SAM-like domain
MSTERIRTTSPGIYRRGQRYDIAYRDPQGRQRWKAARTLREAKVVQAALRADVARGEFRALSRVSFAAYAAEWIVTYQGRTSRGIRVATKADYARDLTRYAAPFFGSRRLSEIEPRDVKKFTQELSEKGLSTATPRVTSRLCRSANCRRCSPQRPINGGCSFASWPTGACGSVNSSRCAGEISISTRAHRQRPRGRQVHPGRRRRRHLRGNPNPRRGNPGRPRTRRPAPYGLRRLGHRRGLAHHRSP